MSDTDKLNAIADDSLEQIFEKFSEQLPRQPFELDDELAATIATLELTETVQSLKDYGYGYIHNAADPEFVARLREAMLKQANDGRFGEEGMRMLVGTDPVFAEAVVNPKLLAILEVVCGKGALLSQTLSSVVPEGSPGISLHADQEWFAEPFPLHEQMVTFCWTTDSFSEAHGSTKVVPGSHKHKRQPRVDEIAVESGAISTECPAGSIVVWSGSTWHCSGPRVMPGERVVFHATFCRLAVRPIESYDHLGEAWLKDQPYVMRVLLGREDFLQSHGALAHGAEAYKRTVTWGRGLGDKS